MAVSQAAFRSAQYAERQKVDDLTLAISSAWTNITEAAIQIEIAQANLDVAGENLSLNTFSYNEGQLAVLDVISSQISWIQAYTTSSRLTLTRRSLFRPIARRPIIRPDGIERMAESSVSGQGSLSGDGVPRRVVFPERMSFWRTICLVFPLLKCGQIKKTWTPILVPVYSC